MDGAQLNETSKKFQAGWPGSAGFQYQSRPGQWPALAPISLLTETTDVILLVHIGRQDVQFNARVQLLTHPMCQNKQTKKHD